MDTRKAARFYEAPIAVGKKRRLSLRKRMWTEASRAFDLVTNCLADSECAGLSPVETLAGVDYVRSADVRLGCGIRFMLGMTAATMITLEQYVTRVTAFLNRSGYCVAELNFLIPFDRSKGCVSWPARHGPSKISKYNTANS